MIELGKSRVSSLLAGSKVVCLIFTQDSVVRYCTAGFGFKLKFGSVIVTVGRFWI